jgi:hypothetical protein
MYRQKQSTCRRKGAVHNLSTRKNMKQPRILAALVVAASASIASTIAWTSPIEPEAASRAAVLGNALVAIEIALPLQPSSRDASAALPQTQASAAPPLPLDGATSSPALIHPAMFLDFDFTAARGRSGYAAGR